ncbi:hypothetical protein EV2_025371 [Malus domestica]
MECTVETQSLPPRDVGVRVDWTFRMAGRSWATRVWLLNRMTLFCRVGIEGDEANDDLRAGKLGDDSSLDVLGSFEASSREDKFCLTLG